MDGPFLFEARKFRSASFLSYSRPCGVQAARLSWSFLRA